MQRTPPTRVHAAHREHVREVGVVLQLQRELGGFGYVVVNRDVLHIPVAQRLFSADPQRLFADADLAFPPVQVRVRQLEYGTITRAWIGEKRHGWLPTQSQGL